MMEKLDRKPVDAGAEASTGETDKEREDRELSKELEMSFPASDPPASTQPGSGITGPETVEVSQQRPG